MNERIFPSIEIHPSIHRLSVSLDIYLSVTQLVCDVI